MTRPQLVEQNPQILGGTPVFVGTRVPVESLTAHLRAGDSIHDFLADFPTVSREQVDAWLLLADELVLAEASGK